MVNYDKIIEILNDNMVLATGCTEPGAIALTAAAAAHALNLPVESMTVWASGNIVKNAYSAGIPGTDLVGIDYAAALGAVVAEPERSLQVINGITPEQLEQAVSLVKAKKVTMELAKVPQKLYIEVQVNAGEHTARAIIADVHTNVVRIEKDGEVLLDKLTACQESGSDDNVVRRELSVAKVYEFATTVDVERLNILKMSIEVNSTIAAEGLRTPYGLEIGRTIEKEIEEGLRSDDVINYAMMISSSAADARMGGADFPVVSNSGSGNQGIASSMPIVAAAERLHASREQTLRAVAISSLMAIYIKAQFGRLSAFCGATVAGIGTACAMTYLLGGGLREIEYAVFNMVGNVTGMLCDGAKSDCALKIATCTNAAMQAALMAVKGVYVKSSDGIVENDVEKTITNFCQLGNEGSAKLDELMLEIMLKKEK